MTKEKRYLDYQKKHKISFEKAKLLVDLDLDLIAYSKIEEIKKPESYLVYVNKYRTLPASYIPDDLVLFTTSELYVRKLVAHKLESMFKKAKKENHLFHLFSAYRSYDYQKQLYNHYISKDGVTKTDKYSARPGHSEHQTGLAVDVASNLLEDKVNDSDYEWLRKNAHHYGFIIRYPKNSYDITGFIEEPWHLRYVGETIAKKIFALHITFDEFYIRYLT